ncbi:hypothetical protein BVX98_02215 [bacterium F11]|nr:hypothetical protein BVX98_02215 [bacterium F11]
MKSLVPLQLIQEKICLIRGIPVMLDKDLAALYQVKPIALRQQVKRNIGRFPADFMFRLTKKETEELVSQNVIPSKQSLGGYLPFAFPEAGVAMLSSVLNTQRAVAVNISIIRAFIKLREMMVSHRYLANRIYQLESKFDAQFKVVFKAIRNLMFPRKRKKSQIGFSLEKIPVSNFQAKTL